MWPFRQALDGAHLELVAQIHGLALRVKQLEESLAALEANHERLRGRFYATRPRLTDQDDRPPQLNKEQLLAKFVPRRT